MKQVCSHSYTIQALGTGKSITVPVTLVISSERAADTVEVFLPSRCCWAFSNVEEVLQGKYWANRCKACEAPYTSLGNFMMALPIKEAGVPNMARILDAFFTETASSPVPVLETKYFALQLAQKLRTHFDH